MVELAGIIFALLVLVDVTLVLLLESYNQSIELAGIIFALSMEMLVGVILVYPFEDSLAWVYSSWSMREVISLCKVYTIRSVGSYLKNQGMQMLK